MAHCGGDTGRQRHQELDVGIGERRVAAPLHREHAQRTRSAENWNRREHGKLFFAQLGEVTVAEVLLRDRDGNGARIFDDRSRDPLAHRQSHLPERFFGKADIAAHDELVAFSFEQVERRDVGGHDARDAARRFVEHRRQGNRPNGEADEIHDLVEPRMTSAMDSRRNRARSMRQLSQLLALRCRFAGQETHLFAIAFIA
jgi:hypothetical protein